MVVHALTIFFISGRYFSGGIYVTLTYLLIYFFRVRNTAHAVRQIVKAGGIKGLWRGWVPNVQRAALVNMGGMQIEGEVIMDNLLIFSCIRQMHVMNFILSFLSSVCDNILNASMYFIIPKAFKSRQDQVDIKV